jgi:hypothetical protein
VPMTDRLAGAQWCAPLPPPPQFLEALLKDAYPALKWALSQQERPELGVRTR